MPNQELFQSSREDIIGTFIVQCDKNKPENAKRLIDYFNITKEEISKNCAKVLYHAVINSYPNIVALLLNHGIKPEQYTISLKYVIIFNKPEIFKLLLNHGITPKQCIDAIKIARIYDYKKIITLLENHINKDKFVIVNKQVKVKSEQEIIKQLFTLAKQLKGHSITIIVNKPKQLILKK